jgi:hypothetical protein
MAKADRKSSTPEDLTTYAGRVIKEQLDELDRHRATVRVANPHYLARFTPTRLAVSPLYRTTQHSGPMTLTPAKARQARSLLTKASLSIPEGLPPPSKRGRKKKLPKDLRELELYLQSAERSDLPLATHLHRWIMKTSEGERFRGARTVKAAIAELQRELRKPR